MKRKSVNKFGCCSICEYPVKIDGHIIREYETWESMQKRCYSNASLKNRPSYINCEICDDWKYYKNFYEWINSQENYNKWVNGGKNWHLDKDILIKNNKIYSPDTCCLVPANVNTLFLSCNSKRGNLPRGVYFDKDVNKFKAQCQNNINGKYTNLGRYNTIEDAFNAYKEFKESIIKKVAEIEYGLENITKNCYLAMMNYCVEITD